MTQSENIITVTVVQPKYRHKEKPDESIRKFITAALDKAPENGIILFPEYSNAGGLSDIDSERRAMAYAGELLAYAAAAAKRKNCIVGINVLEEKLGVAKNRTYLYNKDGTIAFVYDKQHIPPSEIELGVRMGDGSGTCHCTCTLGGIKFAFLTCYDIYFNEQIEKIAAFKPDIILFPGYQRGERQDILAAQAKLLAFRCNAYVLKSSYSMGRGKRGGCSMIVSPDGRILKNSGNKVGIFSQEIDCLWKYRRAAGFNGKPVLNDDFINNGLCPEAFM